MGCRGGSMMLPPWMTEQQQLMQSPETPGFGTPFPQPMCSPLQMPAWQAPTGLPLQSPAGPLQVGAASTGASMQEQMQTLKELKDLGAIDEVEYKAGLRKLAITSGLLSP